MHVLSAAQSDDYIGTESAARKHEACRAPFSFTVFGCTGGGYGEGGQF